MGSCGNNKAGQATLEYVLVFAALIVVVLVLQGFVRAARNSSERTTELVTSDYP